MGKEAKRRQLGREAEGGKVLSTSKKRQREEGLSNERSQDARNEEGEEQKKEERLERAIDELLVECRRKASDSWEKAKKECSLKDVGPALSQSLEVLSQTTRCGQSTEGVFPLPLPEGVEGVLGSVSHLGFGREGFEQPLWG